MNSHAKSKGHSKKRIHIKFNIDIRIFEVKKCNSLTSSETVSIPPPPSYAPVTSPTPEGPESNSVEESSAQTNGPNLLPTMSMKK